MRIRSLVFVAGPLAWLVAAGCDGQVSPPTAPTNASSAGARTHWETGNGGCTPGYWKQEQHFDSWPSALPEEMDQFELHPAMGFNDAFDLGPNSPWFSDDLTLLDALNLGGGGLEALARHAAAALLNATLEFYPITWEEIRERTFEAHALNTPDAIEALKNLFERHNERRCPLD